VSLILSITTHSGGRGDLNLQSSFTVTNATAFTEFSSYMLNAKSFVWHLEGKLNVKALGHTVKDLNLKKDITVNGECSIHFSSLYPIILHPCVYHVNN